MMTETAYIYCYKEGDTYKQRDLGLAACREQEGQQSSSHIIIPLVSIVQNLQSLKHSSQDVLPLLTQVITQSLSMSVYVCLCVYVCVCVDACIYANIHVYNVKMMLANISPSGHPLTVVSNQQILYYY